MLSVSPSSVSSQSFFPPPQTFVSNFDPSFSFVNFRAESQNAFPSAFRRYLDSVLVVATGLLIFGQWQVSEKHSESQCPSLSEVKLAANVSATLAACSKQETTKQAFLVSLQT